MLSMSVNNTSIKRIPDDILSSNDAILAISLMDMKGNILAAKSTNSFKDRFGARIDGEKYGGTLATATLSLVNEVKSIAGNVEAIITVYNKCKMMLIPMPIYQVLVGLVLESSVNAEDDKFIRKIEKFVANYYEV